jgi:hypothetical protein
VDCDGCGTEVEIEVALDATPEANAVAQWYVVAQSSVELGKFSKEFVFQPKLMSMP